VVRIAIEAKGGLITEAVHEPSGNALKTDAPRDNGGQGSAFSPTDLVATALGTCMLTTMELFCRRHDIDLTGAQVYVEKEMVADPHRRIGSLRVDLYMPVPANHRERQAIENAATSCPVHASLSPKVQIPVQFHWSSEQVQAVPEALLTRTTGE
jgi:putative redox protein